MIAVAVSPGYIECTSLLGLKYPPAQCVFVEGQSSDSLTIYLNETANIIQ